MSGKNAGTILILLAALSVIIRIVFVSCVMEADKYYWEDTIHYYSAANSLLEMGAFGYNPERAGDDVPYGLEPVYPLFLAGVISVFGKGYLWIRIVQSILITLSVVPFYKMLRVFVRTFCLTGCGSVLILPLLHLLQWHGHARGDLSPVADLLCMQYSLLP